MWSKKEMEAAQWITVSTSETKRHRSVSDRPSPGALVSPATATTLASRASGNALQSSQCRWKSCLRSSCSRRSLPADHAPRTRL